MHGTYLDDVPAIPDARRAKFAEFVRRELDRAKTERGWSIPKIAEVSGVGSSTIYRWRDGDWKSAPGAGQVVAFCDALKIPATLAFAVLWPSKTDRPEDTRPAPMEPEFEVLLRQLNDPNVSETEKFLIRETVRGLAARAVRRKRDE